MAASAFEDRIEGGAPAAGNRLRTCAVRAWNCIPAVLSFALLAAQLVIPWTVRNFITQDGPSHLYGATILRELLFHHARSIYSPLYTIQRAVIPNWMSTIVLAITSVLAGTAHAEKLFASLAIAIGFFSFHFAVRELWPEAPPWTPIANFLFQVWFLWLGFYNFYLGMALAPLAIGVAARRGSPTWRRSALLSAILIFVFLTHLVAAIIAIVATAGVALWRALWEPRNRLRGIYMSAAAAAPVVLLTAIYAYGAGQPAAFEPRALWAWHLFPMHIFLTSANDAPGQHTTWLFLLCYIALSVFLMKRSEWRTPRGGVAIATVLTFLIYLFVPDGGFGGTQAKIRFAWAVCILGGLFACSVSRLRWFRPVAALCIAWWLSGNFVATYRTAQLVSVAGDDYLAVANRIPPGVSFVRLRYASPSLPDRFGYAGIGRDPLFHLDAFAAVRNHAIDLSDYEPLNPIFPVVYRKAVVGTGLQSGLWGFEGPDPESLPTLKWLNENLPHPIGYVLVIGELTSPEAIGAGMPAMLKYLNANMTLIAGSQSGAVLLYRRQ